MSGRGSIVAMTVSSMSLTSPKRTSPATMKTSAGTGSAGATSAATWSACATARSATKTFPHSSTHVVLTVRKRGTHRFMLVGGKLEGGEYLPPEHAAIVDAYEAGNLEAAHAAIRAHIATGRRIALEAIEETGGAL